MLLTAVCLSLALAQGPPRDARPIPSGTAAIRGTVSSAAGIPLRDAKVSLLYLTDDTQASGSHDWRKLTPMSPRQSRTVVTDASGRFEFTSLAAGNYRVVAAAGPNRGRYLPAGFGATRPNQAGRVISVADGQAITVAIALVPASAIEGRVVDDTGEPVTQVPVSAARVMLGSPVPEKVAASPTLTDDLGRFRIFGLEPGAYVVMAEGTRVAGIEGGAEAFITTFHPSAPGLDGAQRVQVAPGQDLAGIDIQLVRSRRYTVSGTILDSEGRPFGGASATLVRPHVGGYSNQYVAVDGAGRFVLRDVDPGDYKLEVRASNGARPEFAEMSLHVSSDAEDLVVITQPGVTISGRVVFAEGVPAGRPPPNVALYDVPAGGRPRFAFTSGVDAELRFGFKDAFGPKLLRLVSARPEFAITAVMLAGADITDIPTVFRPEHEGHLQVIVTSRAAALEGMVKDEPGSAASDGTVILFPEERSSWSIRSPHVRMTELDDDGRFSIGGLPPGRYLAIAVANDGFRVPPLAGEEFFSVLAAGATQVSLSADERRAVDLRLVRWPE